MSQPIEVFRNNLIEGNIRDPEGVHHEFVGEFHGVKLDFDRIPDDSELFDQWVDITAAEISKKYPEQEYGRLVLIGVAHGTNRLVGPVAEQLGRRRAEYVETRKVRSDGDTVSFSDEEFMKLYSLRSNMGIVCEDVIKSGFTTATAVVAARFLIADRDRLQVLGTWQRRKSAMYLKLLKAKYGAIIHEPMEDFTAAQCEAEGPCSLGWELVKRDGTVVKRSKSNKN